MKQHSAPTAGVSFSPSNDKIIASVGLDKKLYSYDSGSRRFSSCISYEAPFSSLAFREDGLVLAAGTSNGRVVFYDVRGKPQPFTVLRAYSSSEAVTSLCWQRSKPVVVNENCAAETALLGGSVEDSILMPDPHPSATSSNASIPTAVIGSRNASRSAPSETAISFAEETPIRRPVGPLTKLKAPRSDYNFKDDMEVFSPLVEVQPITPSLDKLWDIHEVSKIDNLLGDKKPSSFVFPSSSRRYPSAEDRIPEHPIYDWKPGSNSRQDDTRSYHLGFRGGSTPPPSAESTETSITPPEAWGGERFDKITNLGAASDHPSRFGMSSFTSASMISGKQDVSSTMNQTSMTSLTTNFSNMRARDVSVSQETSIGFPQQLSPSPLSPPLGSTKGNTEAAGLASLTVARRYSTYAERISTNSAFSDGVASPKVKKMGSETREDLLNSLSSRSDTLAGTESVFPVVNGGIAQPLKPLQPDMQQHGSSFPLQLFQRTLEETLGSFRESMREDMRNLHIEILRQFHMQENLYLRNQAEMMKKIESLQKENQELLRQLRR
ncbi:Protein NEDD1 [Linum grandiflorum]